MLEDESAGDRKLGSAACWWLHHSLQSLEKYLGRHGSKLILRRGRAADELVKLAGGTGARAVHALHHYEPWWREAEQGLGEKLDLCLHHGNYLLPPEW